MRLFDRLRLCLPGLCVVCGCPVCDLISLCEDCRARLPVAGKSCRVCGIAVPDRESTDTCGRCQLQPPAFDRCFCVFRYEKPVSSLITEFKYHGSTAKGRVLAQLLTQAFNNHYRNAAANRSADYPLAGPVWPGLLIPVPLHPNRLRSRGFNQALLLASSISRLSGIPVAGRRLRRTRDTASQSRLHARQRRRNLQRAFQSVGSGDAGELHYVAVIDDVVTTTATADAVARVLRAEGAGRIDIWALARA